MFQIEIPEFTQGHARLQKVCDENKRKKRTNDCQEKNFDDNKDFVWLHQMSGMTDFDKLQVNNSSHTKYTICLVNG